MADNKGKISEVMVWKMEKWCKDIIDKMENGETGDHQMFLMMVTFGITYNLEYRRKLFNVWPTYLQHMTALEYKYPEVLCNQLDNLKLPKDCKVIDVACGPGNVANILKKRGYTHVDGLDPSSTLLEQCRKLGAYQNLYEAFVRANEETPLKSDYYDALLCSAGMFPGAIEPQAFPEFLRVVKPGGYLIWNVGDDYQNLNQFFKDCDEIVDSLVTSGKWSFVQPKQKIENLLFSDSGYMFVMKKAL